MNSMPASEFLDRYTSAYGAPWAEVFYDFTRNKMTAKHMAELIDDLEQYGQQSPVYVDKTGMVKKGNHLAMALGVLGEEISFEEGSEITIMDSQVWEVEFRVDAGNFKALCKHLHAVLGFRFETDWIYLIDAAWDKDSKEVSAILVVPSGELVGDRIAPEISRRLETLGGVSASGVRVSLFEAVDEDTSEW